MCYWILTKSVKLIAEKTVHYVTRDEILDDKSAAQIEIFNTDINEQLDNKKIGSNTERSDSP